MLRVFMMDTHVHTCLSPCGELDMHPAGLVAAAVRRGLDAVAICDHNSAENVAAAQRAGARRGLAVVAGIEVTTAEEVHVLALLPSLESALTLQSRIYQALPGRNDPEAFGLQVIANEDDQIVGFNDRLLIGATTWSVDEVVTAIHAVGGVAVAAHVDREGFGILGQLGMIPPGLALDALEISPGIALPEARSAFAREGEFALLCASDAHEPDDVGRSVTFMLLAQPELSEIRRALTNEAGRAVLGGGRPMEDLLMHVLDIAQNAVEAGANLVEIDLVEDPQADRLVIEVRDDGQGMDAQTAAKAVDPFYTTRSTRRVGMGLPLLAEAAHAAAGDLAVESTKGKGTRVTATFRYTHIDRPPLGDVETTLLVLLAAHPEVAIRFCHRLGEREFSLDSRDLRAVLEGEGPTSAPGLALLRAAIRSGEADLQGESHGSGDRR